MPIPHLTKPGLAAYRSQTFRTAPGLKLASQEQAIEFVNQRGFVYFWPIKGTLLPSLWVAVAGDRAVADAHDDPGHVTWGWKDGLLGKRAWFYSKLLRKKATMVSLETLPAFYALAEAYGDLEEDIAIPYEEGRLSQEAYAIYQAILKEGPLHTIELRKAARLSSAAGSAPFERALSELQAGMKLLPVGVAQAGSWRYAFIYEIFARHHPETVETARTINPSAAQAQLLTIYLQSVGAASMRDISFLFGWPKPRIEELLHTLAGRGVVRYPAQLDDGLEPLAALPHLTGQ